MAGRVANQGIQAPQSVPGAQQTILELVSEYPELADALLSTTAWRDSYNYDRRTKAFERMYPGLKPRYPAI